MYLYPTCLEINDFSSFTFISVQLCYCHYTVIYSYITLLLYTFLEFDCPLLEQVGLVNFTQMKSVFVRFYFALEILSNGLHQRNELRHLTGQRAFSLCTWSKKTFLFVFCWISSPLFQFTLCFWYVSLVRKSLLTAEIIVSGVEYNSQKLTLCLNTPCVTVCCF